MLREIDDIACPTRRGDASSTMTARRKESTSEACRRGTIARLVLLRIESKDRDLARQMRRALASMVLNTGEASGSSGGTRRERYRNAFSSARETGAGLDVAVALAR
jgi:four helix bundle protein